MPAPRRQSGGRRGSHTAQTAAMMQRLEPELTRTPAGLVLVVGDVNSTMAAALVAAKAGSPWRTWKPDSAVSTARMPEEINRLVTDVLSDYLFASEPSGVTNLLAEGVPQERIFLVGNVMIDTLLRFRERAAQRHRSGEARVQPRSYAVATLHRPSNVDESGARQAVGDAGGE